MKIPKKYINPVRMITLLRLNFYDNDENKESDCNRDDLERRVEHLMNETTMDEEAIGRHNMQVTYGPRRNTVKRRSSHIVDRLVEKKLKEMDI